MRHTFQTTAGERIVVEPSKTFVNVRISVGGEPINIPAELAAVVAQAIVLCGIEARRGIPHPTLADLPAHALQVAA